MTYLNTEDISNFLAYIFVWQTVVNDLSSMKIVYMERIGFYLDIIQLNKL